jgi:2-polyprenyl-3-methyl-5-hydroxy-6-metoxy-1,4-benzoquinol methylase
MAILTDNHDRFLKEQIDYYQARAGEYDEWFLRRGRYDRGPELNQRWFDEVEILRKSLGSFKPAGNVLELACGTGIWTQYLLQYADQITAVDAASEVLAINQQRTQSLKVRYVHTNLFEWQSDRQYDVVFFSFWLSHVPPERFEAFWKMVTRSLKPDGRIFFIDSKYDSTSTAKDHQLKDTQSTIASRQLNDGRRFVIVKVFYNAQDLSKQLGESGWNCSVLETGNYFFYGYGTRATI